MWRAQTSGSHDGKDSPEILFRDPQNQRFPASVPEHHGWDPLEVYLRSLGKPWAQDVRVPGWSCRIPQKVRSGRPTLVGELGEYFQYLETKDPRGRRCLIMFQKPAPMALLEQMHEQLFEERM